MNKVHMVKVISIIFFIVAWLHDHREVKEQKAVFFTNDHKLAFMFQGIECIQITVAADLWARVSFV